MKKWVARSDRRYEVTALRRPLAIITALLLLSIPRPSTAQIIGGGGGGGGASNCTTTNWASLPPSPSTGACFYVTNAASCSAGTAVTTSGSTPCQLTWNGTGWLPAGNATSSAAGGLTTAGNNLTASGGIVGIQAPVSVANGGTGAITAGATAANNIGAAAEGANSDITSLTGLTTPLSVAQGGTGTGTAGPTLAANIGAVARANNLSDIVSASVARTNLGLGSIATVNSPVPVANGGTGAASAGATAANNVGALAEANNLSDLANAGTARTNLGLGAAATLGVGSGLTSSGGNVTLTTPVTVASGGMGCPQVDGMIFAQLPVSPSLGTTCTIVDALTCPSGATVSAGGGTTACQVTWLGSSWYGGGASTASSGSGTVQPPTQTGNPSFYSTSAASVAPIGDIIHAGTGTLAAAFSALGSNPGTVIADPGVTYTVSAPLIFGTTNDQTLEVHGKINCTDTTGGRDCLDVDVHGHLVGPGPGSGGSSNGCYIGDSATANITSLVANASKTAADGFDFRDCLLDPNTTSTITKGELWLSGAEGFNTISNVRMTQPPVGGSNSGIEYAVDDAGGTRQWNQIDNFAVSVTCGGAAGATGISITATTGGGGSNFTFNGGSVVDCGTSSTYVNIAGNSSVQPKNIHFIDTYFEPDGSGDFVDISDAYAVTLDNVYFNQANASTMTNCVHITGQAGNTGVVRILGRAAPSACTNVINNGINSNTITTAGNIVYTYPGTNGAGLITDGTTSYNGAINSTIARTTLSGTTAGTLVWSEPFQGSSYKRTVLNFRGYENTSGTAQTVSFPTAYSDAPTPEGSCPAGLSLSTSTATLPSSMNSTFTGQCFVDGQ